MRLSALAQRPARHHILMSEFQNDDSIAVFCKMLMDATKVNPEACPVVNALIKTLMDNQRPAGVLGNHLIPRVATVGE